MLTLSLLRHAKSSWVDDDISDFDRPLNGRGRRSAPVIGSFMAKQDLNPDLILCSSARRAGQTLQLLLPELQGDPKIKRLEELYLASPGTMLSHIKAVGARYSRLLLVGHNPGMHALALGLCNAGKADAMRDLAQKFPTAALAVISFDLEAWRSIDQATGHLDLFIAPRQLE